MSKTIVDFDQIKKAPAWVIKNVKTQVLNPNGRVSMELTLYDGSVVMLHLDKDGDPVVMNGELSYCHEYEYLKLDDDSFVTRCRPFSRKFCSVRYWVSDEPMTLEQAVELHTAATLGVVDLEHCVHHSEVTGFLWTDDEFKVGGHDMTVELRGFVGKNMIMEVQTYKQVQEEQSGDVP